VQIETLMKKLISTIVIFLGLTVILVGVSLLFQGQSSFGILVVTGSAILGVGAFLGGLKNAYELLEKIRPLSRKSPNSILPSDKLFSKNFREIVAPLRIPPSDKVLHIVSGDISKVRKMAVAIPINQSFDFSQRGTLSVLASFENITVRNMLLYDYLDKTWSTDERPPFAGIGHAKYVKLPQNSNLISGIIFVVTTRNISTAQDLKGIYLNTPNDGINLAVKKVFEIANESNVNELAIPLLGTGYANIRQTSLIPIVKLFLLKLSLAITIQQAEKHLANPDSPLKRVVIVIPSKSPETSSENEIWEFVLNFLKLDDQEKTEKIENLALQFLAISTNASSDIRNSGVSGGGSDCAC